MKRLSLIALLPVLLTACASSDAASPSTFVLTYQTGTPPSTTPSPNDAALAAVLPSHEDLATRVPKMVPSSKAAGLEDRALERLDLAPNAVGGWKRSWGVSTKDGVSGVLTVEALGFLDPAGAIDASVPALVARGVTTPSSTGLDVVVRPEVEQARRTRVIVMSAVSRTSSVMYLVSIETSSPTTSMKRLAKRTAAYVASLPPSGFSLQG